MQDYELSLAKRDLYLVHIEEELRKKKQFLNEKYNETIDMEEDNEYLRSVRNDYHHYYDFIVSQKKDQISAMQFINDYIDQIVTEGELTDQDLGRARVDQRKILDEISDIQREMDEVTGNYK
jgi:hypothetical protein